MRVYEATATVTKDVLTEISTSWYTRIDTAACRFAMVQKSLELCGFDTSQNLQSPRVHRPTANRTLAASNYLCLLNANKEDLTNWIVIRAVEELIKAYAPVNWARSFVKELEQAKKHDAFNQNNVGDTAQFLCKSGNIWARITGTRLEFAAF